MTITFNLFIDNSFVMKVFNTLDRKKDPSEASEQGKHSDRSERAKRGRVDFYA